MTDINAALQSMRNFYNSNATKNFEFRKNQLQLLKEVIYKYEREIEQALFSDLKKNAEETYATETGLVLSEINVALKSFGEWMRPKNCKTNLVNLPSSSKIYRDPLGVVLIISPWNYPFQLLLIPLVGAIAGGNCALLKPSEFSPATTNLLQKIISEIFPPEYIKVVTGNGEEIVPEVMERFRFDHIFYTGSLPVGKLIYKAAANKLIPVTLELGGKSPAIVHSDADITVAAKRIAFGKFLNTGQTCIAPDYVLVHENVKENFINQLKKFIVQFYGNDASGNYNYGKIINEKRFDKLLGYLNDGKIIIGGKHNKEILFIEPTVLTDVSLDSPVMNEEIFGPLLPIVSFNSTEEAIKIVERNSNPLALYLFTKNKKVSQTWINKVSFGGGCINNTDWHFTNHHLPFGGVGTSGIGTYHGINTFNTFTRPKPVMNSPTWFDPSLKYPPLKGKLKIFKCFIK